MNPFTHLWDYVLGGGSSPWYAIFGDPFIADDKLHITTDDIVPVTVTFPGSYSMKFPAEFMDDGATFVMHPNGGLFFPPNLYPSIIRQGTDLILAGGTYAYRNFDPFGNFINPLANPVPGTICQVGIYCKVTAGEIAMIVDNGIQKYGSGFVPIDQTGFNLGDAMLVHDNSGNGEIQIGTITGFENMTDEEAQADYDADLGAAPAIVGAINAQPNAVPGLLRDQRDVTPSDVDTENAAFTMPDGEVVLPSMFAVNEDGDVVLVEWNGHEHLVENVKAGGWRQHAPFRQIKATGTTPAQVKVGLLFGGRK
jgi:hypothetical protein